MKKLIVFLSLLLCFMSFSAVASAGVYETEPIKFNPDGKFKILNLSDIQTALPLNSGTKAMLEDFVEAETPDLIVLTGDQVGGNGILSDIQLKATIDSFMSIFEKHNVPVAMVFGNHDSEGKNASKERQIEIYETYDCFVGGAGEVFGNRVGNYNIPILSNDEERVAFNLYFTDSGMYNDENDMEGYACVTKEQIQWYRDISNSLKEQNNGEPVPSLNFQHIIVPEIYDVLVDDESGDADWALPEGNDGFLGENPCPPEYSNGQFDAFVEQGDVLATVSGHDHVNSFVVPYKGVDIINTQSSTFCAYNDSSVGYRVFILDENDPENYETYIKTYFDFYGDDKDAQLRFNAYSDEVEGVAKAMAWIQYNPLWALLSAVGILVVTVLLVSVIKKLVIKLKKK